MNNNGDARYFIAQHIPDLFRREGRNVGVFVERDGAVIARFYGEGDAGELDGRKLRAMPHPSVYRQWIEYWRRKIRNRVDIEKELMKANGAHYNVLDGGVVSDTGTDPLEDVCSYLYSILVSEGGFAEAMGVTEDSDEVLAALKQEISGEFRQRSLMARSLWIKHPIIADADVRGKNQLHRPAFRQDYDNTICVMEPVNFVTRQKNSAKDHAGWAAYMFNDIRDYHAHKQNAPVGPKAVESIAIIRARQEDLRSDMVDYAVSVLKANARVVNWLDSSDRDRFISEREKIARTG